MSDSGLPPKDPKKITILGILVFSVPTALFIIFGAIMFYDDIQDHNIIVKQNNTINGIQSFLVNQQYPFDQQLFASNKTINERLLALEQKK